MSPREIEDDLPNINKNSQAKIKPTLSKDARVKINPNPFVVLWNIKYSQIWRSLIQIKLK